jgi:glycerate-2-kinase
MPVRYFKNYKELIGHGSRKARKDALACLASALFAADTYEGSRRVVRRDGNILKVGNRTYHLSDVGDIYVVGAGKGSFPMALYLDRLLGSRIKEGIVLVKGGVTEAAKHIKVIKAGHPVPDQASLYGGKEIQRIGNMVKAGDLVFACMTGGCSALTVLPVDGITLEDKIQVNRLLLKTGAPIQELNAVRKHLSRIKGGGLLKLMQPAVVITLTQDTAPEGLPWPDPCLPDPSTFADAIAVLKNYDIWDRIPESVRAHLSRGLRDSSLETPKSFQGVENYLYDTANQRSACLSAVETAKSLGYNGAVLSTKIEGESKDVGTVLAGIAKEIQLYERPFEPPCMLASAGETTVAISGSAGEGGPNQELVLGFAKSIAGYDGIALVSIDSEGTDGPTDIAGGIADGETARRTEKMGISVFETLKTHDSSNTLKALKDAVITGPTGTNVVNLRVLIIEKRK